MKHLAALALCIALSGCAAKQNITNVPAGVPVSAVQKWDQATHELSVIASTTSQMRTLVISLNASKVFPDGPEYAATLNAIGRVDQLQIQAAQILDAQPNNWTQSTQTQIAALVQQMGQALGTLTSEGVLGIRNPTSQAQVQQLITELTSAASLIVSLT